MSLIKQYKEGSDITLINTMYLYPRKDPKTEKWDKGSITLVYKDNETDKKYNQTIDNPDYELYIAKQDTKIENNELFIEKEKVDKFTVPYNDLEKFIAERTGNMEFYYDNIKNGNRSANKLLHKHPSIFMSDMNIEDNYRLRFSTQYQNNIKDISKSYFDIEADTINMKGDFPELGECPINAVTIINEKTDKVYVFLLRNSKNPLIEEFEKSIDQNLFIKLKDFIRNAVGGWKNEQRLGLQNLDYQFLFYDEEIRLIQDLFRYINDAQPDFVLAWNMAFDIPYIIERIKKLGYSPEEIMCHPDFKNKVARYYIDDRNINEMAERGDYAIISSYSVFLDQMVHFASRRKGQSAFTAFNLDFIGEVVAKVHKLDYKHITTDIAKLPYLDYLIFVFYNIMDTIVQKCIEKKTEDIDYIFGKCIINNTRYQKAHRQTVYLTNRGASEFLKNDLIMGNNMNRGNKKPETKFPGAFVGDPLKVSDYSKIKIDGIPIDVYDNLDDFDYKALYPSILQEFNMAPNTQIGMIEILNAVYEGENPRNDEKFSRGGAFLEDLQSQVYLLFCNRWLKFGNYMELYEDLEEYFTHKKLPSQPLRWCNSEGLIIPANMYNKELLINPVIFGHSYIKPVNFYKIMKSI